MHRIAFRAMRNQALKSEYDNDYTVPLRHHTTGHLLSLKSTHGVARCMSSPAPMAEV